MNDHLNEKRVFCRERHLNCCQWFVFLLNSEMASERERSKQTNPNKHIPKDAQVIMSILKELGITEYEPRVINQLLEFTYRKYHQ